MAVLTFVGFTTVSTKSLRTLKSLTAVFAIITFLDFWLDLLRKILGWFKSLLSATFAKYVFFRNLNGLNVLRNLGTYLGYLFNSVFIRLSLLGFMLGSGFNFPLDFFIPLHMFLFNWVL